MSTSIPEMSTPVIAESVTPAGLAPVADRDLRQRGLVPPQRLAQTQSLVIGVGAIGRQVALQLAAMGIGRMELFDPDTVGVENLAAQGYFQGDVGLQKVHATARLCARLNPQCPVAVHAERFTRATPKQLPLAASDQDLALFCCVDSIITRRLVFEAMRLRIDFFVDGRMNGEVLRVLASDHPAADERYPITFFDAEQAYRGACTARSTIYTANIAAGLMLGQFARWLRGQSVDPDLCLNLTANELSVL